MAGIKHKTTVKQKSAKAPKSSNALVPTAAMQAATSASRPADSSDAFRQMVAEAAYYKAAARGFAPGNAENDWFEAEAEIRSLFG